jgi:hypothetical protein
LETISPIPPGKTKFVTPPEQLSFLRVGSQPSVPATNLLGRENVAGTEGHPERVEERIVRLVLIETAGNQAYIFATNKLRENVGASELTYQTGTRFVLEAVANAGGPNLWPETDGSVHPDRIRRALRDTRQNPPIGNGNPVEVILAVSGKALLLVEHEALGRHIVRQVTLRALREAPGLEVWGAVSRDFDLASVSIHEVIKEVHQDYERVRSRLPGPLTRFQRLPIVMDCATSGLPAARWDNSGRDPGPRSAMSFAKIQAAQNGLKRIRQIVSDARLPHSPDHLEDLGCDWLAIIHADGNGLGRLFLNFDKCVESSAPRGSHQWNWDYIEQLRNFSLALDECTENAFTEALGTLRPRRDRLPIVPLVLGGDDLTVVCDGQQALLFTVKFLESFEQAARNHQDIETIIANFRQTELGQKHLPHGLTGCAGVAIIKPHFPFFAGYELAEALLKSAKQRKPESAFDFHILYDASNPDLDRIRQEWTLDNGETMLTARPYVVSSHANAQGHHHWSKLVEKVQAIQATEDNRRKLPNSMLHELREGLFLGRKQADARLQLVLPRYRKQGLETLLGDNNSLFWSEREGSRTIWRTALLDAMDAAEFLPKSQENEANKEPNA